ncbi:MAG: hypothetical protein HQL48_08110 [Gammaproteobacteria bacterium]|nr:hypothetical protein [Gammaproteobacteria bacterium]
MDKNAAVAKSVIVEDVKLSGSDANNYKPVTDSVSTAAITPRDLNLTVSATDKIYDGTTTANASYADNRITGDNLTVEATARFEDKNAAVAKSVIVEDVKLSGEDATNYLIASLLPENNTATILKAPLTVVASNAQRNYGDENPEINIIFNGFVSGEGVENSGITGNANLVIDADSTTPVGEGYLVTPVVGTLAAPNYQFTKFEAGQLTITPRSLYITANNVVRFAGEADPDNFSFSTGVGGLVNGDTLANVDITPPEGSANAAGGKVFALTTANASFLTGSPINYQISYLNGYLVIIPKPDVSGDEATNEAFFLELEPEEIAVTVNELNRQQTNLISSRIDSFEISRNLSNQQIDEEWITPNQSLGQLTNMNSNEIIERLKSRPLFIKNSDLARLLGIDIGI